MPPAKLRLRLSSILLIVHLFVLVIPIGTIYFFRLYENELVQQTESELIAQGAYISALYKQKVKELTAHTPDYGTRVILKEKPQDEKYKVIFPILDLANSNVHPKRPDAVEGTPADKYALEAGKFISPVLAEAINTTLAGFRITDYNGVIVAGRSEIGLSIAHSEEVANALKGEYSALLRTRISDEPPPSIASVSRNTGVRVFIALPIIDNNRVIGTVLLSRSPRNILKGLYYNQDRVMIAGGMIIFITILLALLTSYTIRRPIYALIRQTQRIAQGDKDVEPIDKPVTQELALLSDNISSMAHTIAERSDYIKNFAMHVSHEFKTPLTSIQGAIELIAEHGNSMPPEQFQKFLTNITKDTDRLKILMSRLLELARADVMHAESETINVNALLNEIQKKYAGKVQVAKSEQVYHADATAYILETVLGNLIENSLQHGAKTVSISTAAENDKVIIDVRDDGNGISDGNYAKLFTPFFTNKREQGGTGLGLVISRSLLRSVHSDIECIKSITGAHFRVLLSVADNGEY